MIMGLTAMSAQSFLIVILLGLAHLAESSLENHAELNTRLPRTCYCIRSTTSSTGKCLAYTNRLTKACKFRECEPSYVCRSKTKSSMLCILRKANTKVVEISPGYCVQRAVKGYRYIPYQGSNINHHVKMGKIKRSNALVLFLVVVRNQVIYRTTSLKLAKRILSRYRRGSRAIFEVKRGKVSNPFRISGKFQLPKNGFNCNWKDSRDVARMRKICIRYYRRYTQQKRQTKMRTKAGLIPTKNKAGLFLIVANNKVVHVAKNLKSAKRLLKRYHTGIRAIFPVKRNTVGMPFSIAGYPQTHKHGFNASWRNNRDVTHMRQIASSYNSAQINSRRVRKPKSPLKRKIPRLVSRSKRNGNPQEGIWEYGTPRIGRATKNKKGLFLIAVGPRVVTHTLRLNSAKRILNKFIHGSRAIFEVKHGEVQPPYKVAGYIQDARWGFNRFWVDTKDISRMRSLCVDYYRRRVLKKKRKPVIPRKQPVSTVKPTKNGLFLVVSGNSVVYRTTYLKSAKFVLKRQRVGSRCLFEVKGNRVVPNPRFVAGYPQKRKYGFSKKWNGPEDIRRMYNIADKYYKKTARPVQRNRKTMKKKGTFIVVAGSKVVGFSRWLHVAKRLLKRAIAVPRAIFEVRRNRVVFNPYRVSGYPQTPSYGFNSKWRSTKDIRQMYRTAREYYKKKNHSTKKIKPVRIRRKFLVVSRGRVVYSTKFLRVAKLVLRRFGRKGGSRCIFEVHGNKVLDNVRQVGGEKQSRGMRAGFNKHWRNDKDVREMLAIAQRYVSKHDK